MQRVHYRNRKPSRPNIVRHARMLGVSHAHLYRVLEGTRQSPDLLRRYKALLKAESASDPHSADRETVEAGLAAAEELLPKRKAGGKERAALLSELLAKLPANFFDAYQRLCLTQFRLRDMQRFTLAILPFFAGLSKLPLTPSRPAEKV